MRTVTVHHPNLPLSIVSSQPLHSCIWTTDHWLNKSCTHISSVPQISLVFLVRGHKNVTYTDEDLRHWSKVTCFVKTSSSHHNLSPPLRGWHAGQLSKVIYVNYVMYIDYTSLWAPLQNVGPRPNCLNFIFVWFSAPCTWQGLDKSLLNLISLGKLYPRVFQKTLFFTKLWRQQSTQWRPEIKLVLRHSVYLEDCLSLKIMIMMEL